MKQLIPDQNTRVWKYVGQMMDKFDNSNGQLLWDFDVFEYENQLKEWTLPHFGLRMFMRYGLIEKFQMSESNLKNLMLAIKNECYETTHYHNSLRIVETTANFHYFVKFGDLMSLVSDLQIMASFLACFMHDLAHPGVNNNFLIGIRHAKALRYNDISVLEYHHCAMAFKLLLDPKNDIFELLSEAQYWSIRRIIVKMILATDISSHIDRISSFKARMQTKKFPEDSEEDKQFILNMCIYASDHCNPCKGSTMYFKWMALEMEEYY